jgi:glucosamine-phosphate N-acetyltransferase
MMDYIVKKFEQNDLQHLDSFTETLENLSKVGTITKQQAEQIIARIEQQGDHIYIAFSEERGIIWSAKLLIEQKFWREGKNAGHIEDVVVRKWFEGHGIWSAILSKIMEDVKQYNCYKVILDCETELVPFYQKFGFGEDGVFMRTYL